MASSVKVVKVTSNYTRESLTQALLGLGTSRRVSNRSVDKFTKRLADRLTAGTNKTYSHALSSMLDTGFTKAVNHQVRDRTIWQAGILKGTKINFGDGSRFSTPVTVKHGTWQANSKNYRKTKQRLLGNREGKFRRGIGGEHQEWLLNTIKQQKRERLFTAVNKSPHKVLKGKGRARTVLTLNFDLKAKRVLNPVHFNNYMLEAFLTGTVNPDLLKVYKKEKDYFKLKMFERGNLNTPKRALFGDVARDYGASTRKFLKNNRTLVI